MVACMESCGLFISLEGGDGAGKTTQAQLLAQWFRDQGRDVVVTREPGGTDLGSELRRLVQHGQDMSARTEALLFAADRSHHVSTVIAPALDAGAVVITDRYVDSSIAYQAGGRELLSSEIEELSRWATGGLMPHLTILLDVDAATAAARAGGNPDRLERAGEDFHARVRQVYLARAAADPARWITLSAAASIDSIQGQMRAAVTAHLEGREGTGTL
jgi:dTMP kinase